MGERCRVRGLGGERSVGEQVCRSMVRSLDADAAARALALAYPDRLAVRRGQPGNFQLRGGTAAWIPVTDPLAAERFLVVADLDGDRKRARVRIAAALSVDDVLDTYANQIEHRVSLVWERGRDELVEKVEERLGGLVLSEHSGRPAPGPAVVEALLARVRQEKLRTLPWSDADSALRGTSCIRAWTAGGAMAGLV